MENIIYYSICDFDNNNVKNTNLPEKVSEHINRHHSYDDTKKSIIAYTKLEEILMRHFNKSLLDVYFNDRGKPCFSEGNISISHCDKMIVVCVSRAPIGVDTEKVGNASKSIYNRVFEPNEIETATNVDFYKRWTALEAKAKMLCTSTFLAKKCEDAYVNSQIIEKENEQYVVTIVSKEKDIKLVLE